VAGTNGLDAKRRGQVTFSRTRRYSDILPNIRVAQ
jgi:hypothetical protein